MHYEDFVIRTIEGLRSTHPATAVQRKGQINQPLLHIPLTNVIPDELHLMLRITDVLIRNLIRAAMQYDAVGNSRITDPLKRPMVTKLLKAVSSCGVSFKIYIKKEGLEFTSLVGNDKKKLLNKLPSKMPSCQPPNYFKTVQNIWKVWLHVYS